MALCHVALAGDALERPTPDMVSGYQALEHAAALLRASAAGAAAAAQGGGGGGFEPHALAYGSYGYAAQQQQSSAAGNVIGAQQRLQQQPAYATPLPGLYADPPTATRGAYAYAT